MNVKKKKAATVSATPPLVKIYNHHNVFLIIGGFFGLLLLVLTPPFQSPDEHDHFFRAVMISSGQFVARSYPFSESDKKKVPPKYLNGQGGVVPISIPYTARSVNQKLPFHPENKQKLSDLRKMLALPLNMKGYPDVFLNTSAAGYAPPLYLPSVLMIIIGKAFKFSPLWLMYLGRLANLMVFLALVYWALRLAPLGKEVIFLIALMPMSLFLAPSLSIDGLIIACSLLLVAALLNLAKNSDSALSFGLWLAIPLPFALIALGKIVYCPLILLFFIPAKKFYKLRSDRYYLLFASVITAVLVVYFWHYLKGTGKPLTTNEIPFDFTSFQAKDKLLPLLDSKKQLDFLIHNPGCLTTVIISTLKEQGTHYFESFTGLLGWLDTELPIWVYISYPISLAIAALSSETVNNKKYFQEKFLLLSSWAISCGGILFGFYLFSTPVANAIIGGIQGRYFIPVALPLLLALAVGAKTLQTDRSRFLFFQSWPAVYSTMVLLATSYSIWQRYY